MVIGIDWGRNNNHVYLLEEGKSFVLKNREKDFIKLLSFKDAVYVIEDGNNRITDYLLDHGKVVYVLPSRKSKEARKYHVTEGKSDMIDSKVIAITYRDHPEWCIRVKREGIALELGELMGERNELIVSSVQDLGRLDAKLERYWPEFRDVFDYSVPRSLAILSICPTAEELLNFEIRDLLKKLKELGFMVDSYLRNGLKELRKISKLRSTGERTKESIMMYSRHAMEKKRRNKDLEEELEEVLRNSEYGVILTIPGIKVITGSLLVTAYLTHKFSNYRDFQRYAGTVPVYYGSGNRNSCHMRKNCNHKLRGLLHMATMSGSRKDSWLRNYYLKKIKEGKSHAHALRALANTILKIAFAMLRDLTPYNEDLFLHRNPQKDYTTATGGMQKPEYSPKGQSVATCRSTG